MGIANTSMIENVKEKNLKKAKVRKIKEAMVAETKPVAGKKKSTTHARGVAIASIIEKVKAKKSSMTSDPDEAKENQKLAIAASIGGIKSAAWKTYMLQFADGTDQLSRLLATDGTENDPFLSEKRAYLVGNGICGTGTVSQFDRSVNTIDQGLTPGCESEKRERKITRKLPYPKKVNSSIIKEVILKQASMMSNPIEARENQELAIAALRGGIKSKAWRKYMLQFAAEGTDQLSRLLARDGTKSDPLLSEKRVYLVGNGICGTGTVTEFDRFVDTIDHG